MQNTVAFGDHKLTFDFNAICLLESVVGPVDVAIAAMNEHPSFLTIRAMLWAGLHRTDHTITMERAGDIFQGILKEKSLNQIMVDMMAAVDSAFPDMDEDGDGELGNDKPG